MIGAGWELSRMETELWMWKQARKLSGFRPEGETERHLLAMRAYIDELLEMVEDEQTLLRRKRAAGEIT